MIARNPRIVALALDSMHPPRQVQTPTAPVATMDDRNFRYGYYEKVGFGGIEERKSLEVLLREHPKPPDLLPRLSYLTSRYSLSAIHRKLVYQLLLDVISPISTIADSRLEIQREIARDIIKALEVMQLVNPSLSQMEKLDFSSDGHPRLLVLMFLFETKKLEADVKYQFERADIEDLLCISDVFTKEFLLKNTLYSLEDSYWIYKHFITAIEGRSGSLLETYDEFIRNFAKKDATLYAHLETHGVIKNAGEKANNTKRSSPLPNNQQSSRSRLTFHLDRQKNQLKFQIHSFRPMITWFVRFFAGIVHHTFLIRVFDKLIGCLAAGQKPFPALVSLGNALLTHRRADILQLNSFGDITKCLFMPLSFDDSEEIVIDALSNY